MFQQIYKPQKIKDEKVRIRTGFERINIDIKRRMKRLGHDPRMVNTGHIKSYGHQMGRKNRTKQVMIEEKEKENIISVIHGLNQAK